MQPTETVRVASGVRRWFWYVIGLMLLSVVLAATFILYKWINKPTNAELVEQFEAFGGQVDIEGLSNDELSIGGLVINARVPPDVWRSLAGRGNPKRIALDGLEISSDDWQVLGSSGQLTYLSFRDCQFDAASMSLETMQSLEILELWWSHAQGEELSDEMLEVLIDSLSQAPSLTALWINHCPLTDDHLSRIVQNAPQLEHVVFHATQLTEDCIHSLAGLIHLKLLTLDELPASAASVLSGRTSLRGISVRQTPPSGEQCIELFERIETLESITIVGAAFNEEEIRSLNDAHIGKADRTDYSYLYRMDPPR